MLYIMLERENHKQQSFLSLTLFGTTDLITEREEDKDESSMKGAEDQ